MNKNLLNLLLIVTILCTISLGCVGMVQTYDTSPEILSLGETANIDNVAFIIERYELRDEFVGNHDLTIFYSTEGNKFLYLLVKAENLGNEPVEIPSQYDIGILYKNHPYKSEVSYHSEEFEMYEYNWLEDKLFEPNHVKEGWILFQVPETINTSDVQVTVEFPHTSYTRTAIWNLTLES
jgi:hypothetical protein